MSGIYGLFRRNEAPIDLKALAAMHASMTEWGPDAHCQWVGCRYATGFVLMRNTPESFYEQQPILEPSEEPRFVISADARIDNRQELCLSLGLSSAVGALATDSELVRRSYLKWGERYAEHLVGAYAVAIWDCVNRTLHLTRDHMGFRPLYFFANQRVVVFASSVEAILCSGEVPRTLDHDAVAAARAQNTIELRERSLIKGIRKVLPACSLMVDDRREVKQKYWNCRGIGNTRYARDGDYADAMREQLMTAVKACTRSAYPIGSHLSGGLDSSAVTIAATRCLQESGRALSGAFAWSPQPVLVDEPLTDERSRIAEVCARESLDCYYSELSVDDIVGVWLADMSTRPPETMYNEIAVRRNAKKQGIRTLLSGWGGDEFATFNGRSFYCEQLLRLRWSALTGEMRRQHQLIGASYKDIIKNKLLLPFCPPLLYSQRPQLIPTSLQQDALVSSRVKQHWRAFAMKSRHQTSMAKHHQNAIDVGWLSYRIEGWAAWGVGDSIDYRYPLLDRRMIEFCMSLPPEQFLKNGWGRYIFRYAVDELLPTAICWSHDNKHECAKRCATQAKILQAFQVLSDVYQSGVVDPDNVPSMWQDLRFTGTEQRTPI